MKHMLLVPGLLSLFLMTPMRTTTFAEAACKCEPRSDPKEKKGSVEKSPGPNFEWISDADQVPKSTDYCYERIVTNNHREGALKYRWPLGRLRNEALAPNGGKDRICEYWGDYKKPATQGPLYYGRADDSVDTQVWEAVDEPPPPKTKEVRRVASVEFTFLYLGSVDSVKLDFASVVSPLPSGGYEYRYQVAGVGPTKVLLAWLPPDPEQKFIGYLKETLKMPVPFQLIDPVRVKFEDHRSPVAVIVPAQVYSRDGKVVLGTAHISTYVPAK